MGTQLKQHVGAVLAGLPLLAAVLATTPGLAQAQNLKRADRTVSQVAAQNAGQVGNNANVGPNAAVGSPGTRQQQANNQTVGDGGNAPNTNSANRTSGQAAVQNGPNAGSNLYAAPNAALLSRGANQTTFNQQDARGFAYGGQNAISAERTIGQVAVQGGPRLSNNANLAPNASVLSAEAGQASTNRQGAYDSAADGNAAGAYGSAPRNANSAERTAGQAVFQDAADVAANLDASPNAAALSPGSAQNSAERLRPTDLGIGDLFERVRDAVVVADARTQRIVLWNPAATRMFGYAAREALKLRVEAIVPDRLKAQHRAGIARYAGTGRGVYMGSGEPFELPAVRKDGREIDVELSLSPIGPAGTSDGGGRFVLAILRDVTERKRTEKSLQAYAKKLETSNRELEEFAYVASHDLQEPLRKVSSFGERLRNKYGDALGQQGLDYLRRMEGATVRMQGLIEDLLSLSRVTTQANPFEPVDLDAVAEEVLSDLEARVEESGGRVEVGGLPTVEADRAQMRQLLQNLIGNSLKFHKDDVPPVVKVYGAPENGAPTNGGRPPRCRLVVEDNGIGFEEEHLSRIFVPFERLHGRGAYEGMGMGLAICRKVVERHGGEITASSSPGQGATFIVTLPVGQP